MVLVMVWSVVNTFIATKPRGMIYCKLFLMAFTLAVWSMFIICHNYMQAPQVKQAKKVRIEEQRRKKKELEQKKQDKKMKMKKDKNKSEAQMAEEALLEDEE